MEDVNKSSLIALSAEVVAAYVERNSVPRSELIAFVHVTLARLGSAPAEPAAAPLKPAVPAKKSVSDDYIISLEDGRKLKSMKRYLARLGMTPEDYRNKWNLPRDYPMTAPAYAKQRSELAHKIGLGRKVVRSATRVAELELAVEAPAKKRGRQKAA